MPVDLKAVPVDEFPDWASACCICGEPVTGGRFICEKCGYSVGRVILSGGDEPVHSMPLCTCGAEAYLGRDGWRCTISEELTDICPLGET